MFKTTKIIIVVLLLGFTINAEGQIKVDLKKKVENAVNRRANQRTDQAIDKGLDAVENAVKAFPTDTLSVNNFGAYLRNIDSTAISIPVLLYANKLFSQSPVILTQLGNNYFELNDFVKAESYYKQALKNRLSS